MRLYPSPSTMWISGVVDLNTLRVCSQDFETTVVCTRLLEMILEDRTAVYFQSGLSVGQLLMLENSRGRGELEEVIDTPPLS